jgi:hypothetical protein
MKQLKFIGPSDIIVSTINIPDTKLYETMIFNSTGDNIFCRVYNNEPDAIKWHDYYMKQNSK